MKYVMFKRGEHYVPIIFPETLVHADVAEWMRLGPGYQVHSAGFISPLSMKCHGRSESLGVESDPGDTVRIRMNDYGGGFM